MAPLSSVTEFNGTHTDNSVGSALAPAIAVGASLIEQALSGPLTGMGLIPCREEVAGSSPACLDQERIRFRVATAGLDYHRQQELTRGC